jgi:hypothetical protein
MSKRGAFAIPELPGCRHTHYKDEPTGYVAWFDWVERKATTHEQLQCPVCHRWAIWKPKRKRAAPGETEQTP